MSAIREVTAVVDDDTDALSETASIDSRRRRAIFRAYQPIAIGRPGRCVSIASLRGGDPNSVTRCLQCYCGREDHPKTAGRRIEMRSYRATRRSIHEYDPIDVPQQYVVDADVEMLGECVSGDIYLPDPCDHVTRTLWEFPRPPTPSRTRSSIVTSGCAGEANSERTSTRKSRLFPAQRSLRRRRIRIRGETSRRPARR